MASSVIEIDTSPKVEITSAGEVIAGDTYLQKFLASKIRLTALGLYLLDYIKGCQTEQEIIEKAKERFESGIFVPPEHPHRHNGD